MLEVGTLYNCKYYLMLYPELESARLAQTLEKHGHACAAHMYPAASTAWATYWTNELGKPVGCVVGRTPILALRIEENFHQVLTGDRIGWIIYHDWLNFEEIQKCKLENFT